MIEIDERAGAIKTFSRHPRIKTFSRHTRAQVREIVGGRTKQDLVEGGERVFRPPLSRPAVRPTSRRPTLRPQAQAPRYEVRPKVFAKPSTVIVRS